MKKRNTKYKLNKVDYTIFIVFSFAAATMFYLFYKDLTSFTIKQTEDPVAKIYFKKNTAQRKFQDNEIWEILTNSSDIYEGDRIRTSKNSEAYTEFQDNGIQIQLHEKSMIQIIKNKEQKAVDFVGGEIFVANNNSEEKFVIQSGKREIAISDSSEAILSIPEEKNEENELVIDVLKGQVEVTEQGSDIKTKLEPVVLSAGKLVALGKEGHYVDYVNEGLEKTITMPSCRFDYNPWYDEQEEMHYNYSHKVKLSRLAGYNKAIRKNSVLEIEMQGVLDYDLNHYAIQITTGEDEWIRAHPFINSVPNNGQGIKKGVPFSRKEYYILDREIVNTDKAEAEIIPVQKGFKKTIELGDCYIPKNTWDDSGDYCYELELKAWELLGRNISIPKGRKVKISISGKPEKELDWLTPMITHVLRDKNLYCFTNNEDLYPLRIYYDKIIKNRDFHYSRTYTLINSLQRSDLGLIKLYCYANGNAPSLLIKDLKVTFEFE